MPCAAASSAAVRGRTVPSRWTCSSASSSVKPWLLAATRARAQRAGEHGAEVGCVRLARVRRTARVRGRLLGEQVEVALFGGESQDGTLTAYCSIEDVPHVELNGHILIPLQNVASLHCSSRCDAPEPDWPPRSLTEDESGES